jgi:subtilisin family serine protease
VGALNPDNRTVALFSNIGSWVKTYAPGSSVLSISPAFEGAVQAGTKDDVRIRGDLLPRASIDPDDFTGGFAVWSGTSFAAPYVAGAIAHRFAQALGAQALAGGTEERCKVLRAAAHDVIGLLRITAPVSPTTA